MFISELFDLYSRCKNSKEVVQVQNEYLENIQAYHDRKRESRDDAFDIPSEEESEEESVESLYFDKFGNSITKEEKEKMDQLLNDVKM